MSWTGEVFDKPASFIGFDMLSTFHSEWGIYLLTFEAVAQFPMMRKSCLIMSWCSFPTIKPRATKCYRSSILMHKSLCNEPWKHVMLLGPRLACDGPGLSWVGFCWSGV